MMTNFHDLGLREGGVPNSARKVVLRILFQRKSANEGGRTSESSALNQGGM
jgi:hypothetical protein